MVEYLPAGHMQARSASVAADFCALAGEALFLADLVACFSLSAAAEGVTGHACHSIRGEQRKLLFGNMPGASGGVDHARFTITGWDENAYSLEVTLAEGFLNPSRRANLHAMAALYLGRALALLEAEEASSPERLTPREGYCLEKRGEGLSDLDIGEELGLSAQAVAVIAERAERKLRPAISQLGE